MELPAIRSASHQSTSRMQRSPCCRCRSSRRAHTRSSSLSQIPGGYGDRCRSEGRCRRADVAVRTRCGQKGGPDQQDTHTQSHAATRDVSRREYGTGATAVEYQSRSGSLPGEPVGADEVDDRDRRSNAESDLRGVATLTTHAHRDIDRCSVQLTQPACGDVPRHARQRQWRADERERDLPAMRMAGNKKIGRPCVQ